MITMIVLSIGSMLAGAAVGLLNASEAESAKSGLQQQAIAAQSQSLKELQQDFLKLKIGELVEPCPDVFYLWNDALDPKIMPADEAQAFIRGLRVDLVASSNGWDWRKKGTPYADIAVKELRQFPENNTAPGETCWCLEEDRFRQEGIRPKTARQVQDLMATVNSRNSNLLLSVGPNKQGRFEKASVKVLAEVGRLRE